LETGAAESNQQTQLLPRRDGPAGDRTYPQAEVEETLLPADRGRQAKSSGCFWVLM